MSDKIALIEAGGTKFIVGVGDASRQIYGRTRIDTTRPEETIPAAIDWLRAQGGDYAAVGIASFGPLDLEFLLPPSFVAQLSKVGVEVECTCTPFRPPLGRARQFFLRPSKPIDFR